MSNDKRDNFYKRRKRVIGAMKQSTVFRDYVEYVKEVLENEREKYEDEAATEFARGRVSMLKSLIDELENGK